MEGIRKYYPSSGVLANDSSRLVVEAGEIHALVGENGAGKSTLMRILYGLESPDSGTISLGGRGVRIRGPAQAGRLGIGMVQQHFTLVPDFSVAENIVLGREPRKACLFFDKKRAEEAASAILEEHGFRLSPSASVATLSIAERQELEIAKLLYREAEILILDEPTALLAEGEAEGLFASLRRLRNAGKTVILITHRVREVKEVSDAVTVMRRGRSVAAFATEDADEATIAELMMGPRRCAPAAAPTDAPAAAVNPGAASAGAAGAEVFSMRSVSLVSRRRGGRPLVDSLCLSVRSGEILGVCGMVGSGLGDLEDLVSGFARPSRGAILLEGTRYGRRRRRRLGYVPADRMGRGSCLEASVLDNLVALDRGRFFPGGLADLAGSRAFAEESMSRYAVAARAEDKVGYLSGGNVQKIVLARELAGGAPFLVFSNPTHGLDIASSEFVLRSIADARSRGAAVLLLSADLDEILALSDRVAVMYRGRIVAEIGRGPGLDRRALGRAMLGLGAEAEEAPSGQA